MRRDDEFFGEAELDLIYVAKRLADAQSLEALLTQAGWDYYVEADDYQGGFLFRATRTGAFFYVLFEKAEQARALLTANGYRPQPPVD